ncbi:MAG: hypothetical protein KME29_35165 [Calothrix sp. FI2-JRJ7]|jgi:hypothetical protein|nr:hypothetical protein [Calothrix sp. FI2-JRJ7]
MKLENACSMNQRCILMVRAEAGAIAHPDLGEEIYTAWVETMDLASPNHADLNNWIDVLTVKYQVSPSSLRVLFEAIRLIIIWYGQIL